MRFSAIVALFFSTVVLAAPVDLTAREADAEAIAAPEAEAKPQYGSYGDYAPPSTGYGSYGDYPATNPPSPAYGSYSPYGNYGAYKKE